ncbi:hypothetical protein SRM_p84008 (plasmid) [Salinibacter ruber M8]|uniref:Uncharacterized protein n=1 Tax=Salinibacter ruber (strain M8) TaxID=761659 RepID=D6CVY5_SALRM|nr:hypothetical protein SRM_p84008 [Salinibacter ruber M8]
MSRPVHPPSPSDDPRDLRAGENAALLVSLENGHSASGSLNTTAKTVKSMRHPGPESRGCSEKGKDLVY